MAAPSSPELAKTYAAQLGDIIQTTVAPVYELQDSNVLYGHQRMAGLLAVGLVSTPLDQIHYSEYDPNFSSVELDLRSFGYTPGHVLDVRTGAPYEGYARYRLRALFAATQGDEGGLTRVLIARATSGGDFLSRVLGHRALDNRTSQSVINYASSPHLAMDDRERLLAIDEDESAALLELSESVMEFVRARRSAEDDVVRMQARRGQHDNTRFS